jgi:vacuolar-type H+-ATPase subunit I/STV1
VILLGLFAVTLGYVFSGHNNCRSRVALSPLLALLALAR